MAAAEPEAVAGAASPWADWLGRSETVQDLLHPTPARALAATLDRAPPREGDALPPLWHWLYGLPLHPQSELGRDGHARRGGFLPPVPLPRRMWAGGRLEWAGEPLRLGGMLRRVSTVESVSERMGRSGALVFVAVRHDLHAGDAPAPALREWHHIVYREPPRPGPSVARDAAEPALPAPRWQRTLTPDAVLLFRYSALTFNGHRIHYDHPYATAVEGYPGLVVHGPLLATLLMDGLLHEAGAAPPARFAFRALRPCFAERPLRLCGAPQDGGWRLWVLDERGALAMDALASP